jgi:hypothetical protein
MDRDLQGDYCTSKLQTAQLQRAQFRALKNEIATSSFSIACISTESNLQLIMSLIDLLCRRRVRSKWRTALEAFRIRAH